MPLSCSRSYQQYCNIHLPHLPVSSSVCTHDHVLYHLPCTRPVLKPHIILRNVKTVPFTSTPLMHHKTSALTNITWLLRIFLTLNQSDSGVNLQWHTSVSPKHNQSPCTETHLSMSVDSLAGPDWYPPLSEYMHTEYDHSSAQPFSGRTQKTQTTTCSNCKVAPHVFLMPIITFHNDHISYNHINCAQIINDFTSSAQHHVTTGTVNKQHSPSVIQPHMIA